MKITAISITESASMPGRFSCTYNRGSKTFTTEAGHDPQAAAAKAVEIALNTSCGYTIFAPSKVLDLIPSDMRSRR